MEGAEADERSRARPSMAMGFSHAPKRSEPYSLVLHKAGTDRLELRSLDRMYTDVVIADAMCEISDGTYGTVQLCICLPLPVYSCTAVDSTYISV